MRGKPLFHTMRCGGRGITPAGAGKTEYKLMVEVQAQDHPRRCGENFFQNAGVAKKTGSPPQVRGKPQADCHVFRRHGITPAGAGKTPTARHLRENNWDHPRRCGENSITAAALWGHGGSPPQVRGKPLRWERETTKRGSTPAGAGKTSQK